MVQGMFLDTCWRVDTWKMAPEGSSSDVIASDRHLDSLSVSASLDS
jgi:hypothetical protein